MAAKSNGLIGALVLVVVVTAALWAFGLPVPGVTIAGRLQADHPLATGGTLWDSFPNAATHPPVPRPTPDTQETQVLLQDWEYTASRPISHWRR